MDDLIGKISELLSDEESFKQISELAQMFMSDASDNSDENSTKNSDKEFSEDNTAENLFNSFDFSKILKLQELYGVFSKNDKNTDLLLALKPHLNEEKQEKIDKAIKILKLLAVWNLLKDSGLLKDFL